MSQQQRKWAIRLLALITLMILLGLAFYPLWHFFAKQNEARDFFQREFAQLKAELPPPQSPDLPAKMPLFISPKWRDGFLYYPERNAYKYTFAPRYHYNHMGKAGGLTAERIPEAVERRSVWLKPSPDGTNWQCYAGVKNRVRGDLCQDFEIIKQLKREEHQQAVKALPENWRNCGEQINAVSRSWVSEQSEVYVLDNYAAEHIHIHLAPTQKAKPHAHQQSDLILIVRNHSNHEVDLTLEEKKSVRIMRFIIVGKKGQVNNKTDYRFNDDDIHTYDKVHQQCNLKANEVYTERIWQAQVAAFIQSIPPEHLNTFQIRDTQATVHLGGQQ